MNKLSGISIVMDIENLAGANLKFDKAPNPCKIGLSDVGGGGSLTLIVNFSQCFHLAQGRFLVPKCINSTKEV